MLPLLFEFLKIIKVNFLPVAVALIYDVRAARESRLGFLLEFFVFIVQSRNEIESRTAMKKDAQMFDLNNNKIVVILKLLV